MHELNEQETARRNGLAEMRKLGIEPYPAAEYPVNASAEEILGNFSAETGNYQNVSIAGRIMSRRIMGSASFMELMDATGRIQIYVKRDDLCPDEDKTMYNTVFKRLLDIGDIIGVRGFVFITQMGETSIHVKELTVLSKSLRVLPIVKEKDGQVFDAFTDPEQRYRMRYVDLLVNPHVKDTFMKRTQVINTMRDFFNSKGYVEVDTPVLQPIPGGAAARPFITHHNALNMDLYLRIAPELYLKRLLVGGLERVFEINRNFRNEGIDTQHNPEFTMLEFYQAYATFEDLMSLTEQMLSLLAKELFGEMTFQYQGEVIDFTPPWERITVAQAVARYGEVPEEKLSEEGFLKDMARGLNIPVANKGTAGDLLAAIFEEVAERRITGPAFVTEYPIEVSPLSRRNDLRPHIADRFELIVRGREIANAFSELNDPADQKARFEEQLRRRERGDEEAHFLDSDYIRALEYGMPPAAGEGIGIDRLVMLLTDSPSIREVILFPQLRKEG